MKREYGQWIILEIIDRFDSSNYQTVVQEIDGLLEKGTSFLALDLSQEKFLSIPAIQYLVSVSERLERAGGELALLNPSIRTRRHIKIYGTLTRMGIYSSAENLLQSRDENLERSFPPPLDRTL